MKPTFLTLLLVATTWTLASFAQSTKPVKPKRHTIVFRVVTSAHEEPTSGVRKGVGYQEVMRDGKLSQVRKISLSLMTAGDPNRTCINALTNARDTRSMFHITGDGTMVSDGALDLYTITNATECDVLMPPIEL